MNLSQLAKLSKFGVNIHLEHFSYFMVVSSSKKFAYAFGNVGLSFIN